MKLTKLSLVAALAVSSAFAGGDIAPVEPVVVAPVVEAAACNSNTTVSGKAQAYYYTTDDVDLFDSDSSAFATAVTLDVKHNFTENIAANFTAVGYANLMSELPFGYFENDEVGAYLNVANITATFGGTTFVLGRQLIDSPMFGSFDWLLAPSSFEAYTVVNSSINNLTLVGTYVTKVRMNNAGDNFTDLTDINDGNNYALGAAYAADALSASVWYYNIDSGDYTQVYVDAGYNFGSVSIAAQYATTDYALGLDSDAYAAKVETTLGNFDLMAAVSNVTDAGAGYVSRDGLYTSSWNYFASDAAEANEDTLSWKVSASTELAGLNAEVSYAVYGDEGSELDVILGYDVTKCINVAAVYTSTDYDVAVDASESEDALELIATYKF
jgi:hypothetical protein